MNESCRVVVTGVGVVSCLDGGVPQFWDSLLAGRSGIRRIAKYDPTEFRCHVGGEVRNLDITKYVPAKEARRMDPFCHYALVAADEAVAQAGLADADVDPSRAGVMVGAGIGGIGTLQEQCEIMVARGPSRNSPLMVPMMIIDLAAGILSIRYGFKGPNLGMVTACASGSHAIGESAWIIKRGDADVMVTGGAEACIVPLGMTGFCAMKALTTRNDDPEHASRPFDAGRDGFVPGEGAGILVLESEEHARKRGAEILAEVVGYGLSGDAHHITAPDPSGEGPANAIRGALRQAGMQPEELDYVNAHGTSTPLNDKTETVALKQALGDHAYKVPISSIKSMVGHALGAAGGLESVVCIQAILHGAVPPTINYETPDPECDLDYVPNVAREVKVDAALNVNLGFGGHNAALIFKKWG